MAYAVLERMDQLVSSAKSANSNYGAEMMWHAQPAQELAAAILVMLQTPVKLLALLVLPMPRIAAGRIKGLAMQGIVAARIIIVARRALSASSSPPPVMQIALIVLALAAVTLATLSQRCKLPVLLVPQTHPTAPAPVKGLVMQATAAAPSPILVLHVLRDSTRVLLVMSLVHCAQQACIRQLPAPLIAPPRVQPIP